MKMLLLLIVSFLLAAIPQPASAQDCVCATNTMCSCAADCVSGYVRAVMPDNSSMIKYFEGNAFSIPAGSAGGDALARISCLASGTESNYSISVSSCPDTAAPNMTILSVGGDATPPYSTANSTPEIVFSTDERAWCRVSLSDSSYDAMGAGKDCPLEQGIKYHVCISPDAGPSFGGKTAYLACRDSAGNNHTSANNMHVIFDFTAPPPFNFTLSASPPSGSVQQGCNVSATVAATLISGTPSAASLSCSGAPPGAACSFSPASITPTAFSILTISANASAALGNYSLTIRGVAGNLSVTATYNLTVSDIITPSNIADLAASSPSSSSIQLSWTAPGDDGNIGTALQYDIRYSTSAITNANWGSAAQAVGEPTPAIAGTKQFFAVSRLNQNTTYYFAIKTADEFPNWSGLSNVASGTTKPVSAKDPGRYTARQAFLISDEDWRAVMGLVPVSVWTDANKTVNAYPALIYHREGPVCSMGCPCALSVCQAQGVTGNSECAALGGMCISSSCGGGCIDWPVAAGLCGCTAQCNISACDDPRTQGAFDADSIISFFQQYAPGAVKIVGNSPADLDNLLVAAPPVGAGLNSAQIKRIYPEDYLSYWKSYDSVVYVENNYTMALMASVYASLTNSPLIIKGYNDGNISMNGINVICVGNPSPNCSSRYTMEELTRKYANITKTDKLIMVNPNDLDIYSSASFTPEKSGAVISNIYGKTSLIAPFLAASKYEMTLPVNSTDYSQIDSMLKSELNKSTYSYLTIVASPDAIPFKKWESNVSLYRSLDQTQYADMNIDFVPDLYAGRIMGITISDASCLVWRSIFYQKLDRTNNMNFLASSFDDLITNAKAWSSAFKNAGYNATNRTDTFSFDSSDWSNKHLISYGDHGSYSCAGISSSNIPILNNSLLFIHACSTCADANENTFCTRAIRRGAVMYIGAVGTAGGGTIFMNAMNNIYYRNQTAGQAIQNAYNDTSVHREFYEWYWMITLLGDPTLQIQPIYYLPEPLRWIP